MVLNKQPKILNHSKHEPSLDPSHINIPSFIKSTAQTSYFVYNGIKAPKKTNTMTFMTFLSNTAAAELSLLFNQFNHAIEELPHHRVVYELSVKALSAFCDDKKIPKRDLHFPMADSNVSLHQYLLIRMNLHDSTIITELLQTLFNFGFSPPIRENFGVNALYYSISISQPVVSLYLLREHAECFPLDACHVDGKTVLHAAVIQGQLSVAQELIALGADPTAVDMEGKDSFYFAKRCFDPLMQDYFAGLQKSMHEKLILWEQTDPGLPNRTRMLSPYLLPNIPIKSRIYIPPVAQNASSEELKLKSGATEPSERTPESLRPFPSHGLTKLTRPDHGLQVDDQVDDLGAKAVDTPLDINPDSPPAPAKKPFRRSL